MQGHAKRTSANSSGTRQRRQHSTRTHQHQQQQHSQRTSRDRAPSTGSGADDTQSQHSRQSRQSRDRTSRHSFTPSHTPSRTSSSSLDGHAYEQQLPIPTIDWAELDNLFLLHQASQKNLISASYRGVNVVIKTPSEHIVGAELDAVVNELQREAQIMSRLNHPNIIKFFGHGWLQLPTGQVGYFLVVERLQGTLSERLAVMQDSRRPKPLPMETAVDILTKLAAGMHYLHTAIPEFILVHRDLKPDNVGFAPDGVLKIFDFGLSGIILRRDLRVTRNPLEGFRGSVRYMAPEVVLGQPYSELIDVYSFAMVAWEITHGEKPYSLLNVENHRRIVCVDGARPDINRRAPLRMRRLMIACWSQDASARPSFERVVTELNTMASEASQSNGRASSPAGRFSLFRRRR